MKKTVFLLLGLAFVLANGCVYDQPVAGPALPLDNAFLGKWRSLGNKPEELLALKFSDKEYIVEYPQGEDGMLFRAYPVEVGKLKLVQLQLLGSAKGPVKDADRKFHLCSCAVVGDRLELRMVSQAVVDGKKLKTSEAIRAAVIANEDNPGLFESPEVFAKLPEPR